MWRATIDGVTEPSPATTFRAGAALGGLGRFAAVGGGLTVLGALGVGLPCPWRALTGTLCPFCGATHLGVAFLRLDAAAAFAANPFLALVLVGLGGLGVLWTVEALGGPGVRPPSWLTRTPDRWWLALGVLGVTWAVLRNVWAG